MSGLFGGQSNAGQVTKAAGIRVQTSIYGKCIAIVYGQNRIAGNLIWYGDFQAKKVKQGGKGGGSGGESYEYKASIVMGLCEGPIVDVPRVWSAKEVSEFAESPFGTGVLKLGTYPQTPWTYMETSHPDEALGYQGLAHAGGLNIELGSSADLPNFNFEVNGRLCESIGELVDADPADIITDLLTNVNYSAILASDKLDLALYSDYCRAAGLLLSPVYEEQRPVSERLEELVELTNSAIIWSGGKIKIVPYGDESLTGNGETYTPPAMLSYILTDDDFKPTQDDPVELRRKNRADAYNVIRLEYSNRERDYDPDEVEVKDDASIELYGERPDEGKQARCICVGTVAQLSAQLALQRQNVLNEYRFVLGWEYILIEPMDIIRITDTTLGLVEEPVRVLEITEDEDGYLSFLAEEVIPGIGTAEAYPFAVGEGFRPGFNADPGNVNAPAIFEPPEALVTAKGVAPGLQLWAALSGGINWGGCEIWVSTDGGSNYYKRASTAIGGGCTQGVLLAELATATDPDTMNTLSVDLTQSRGELVSGTQTDADMAHTLCLVEDELVAYQTATLGAGQYQYDLEDYLRRGMFDTTPATHAIDAPFAFIDENVLANAFLYESSLVGVEINLKFLSFNLYGRMRQDLSDVSAYTYTPGGGSNLAKATTDYVDTQIGDIDGAWASLPIYADNTAAVAGGLAAGDRYRTSTGTVMIVY